MRNTCVMPIAVVAVLAAAPWLLAAQNPAPQPNPTPQPAGAEQVRREKILQILGARGQAQAPAPMQSRPQTPPQVPVPAAQPQPGAPVPETPKWPANEAAVPAKVELDSRGLHIDAENSSLRQILSQVATVTGARLEGLGADERVFGEYGPGQARDVLAQLLHGSPYNVMLVGDQGQGTPREIVLSARANSGNAPTRAASQQQDSEDDSDADQPEQQPVPVNQPPMNQPGNMRQQLRQRGVPMQPPNLPQPPNQQP